MDDKSAQTDGTAASENMTGGIVSEYHTRIGKLERANADLTARLEAAQNSGNVEPYPGFGSHVVHVLTKHFYHDRPDELPTVQG